jgi:hypothetical protein
MTDILGTSVVIGTQRPRLRGVQHLPQADIQNIRDLLRGYGSAGSLIKELIQNAEDAEAKHLDFILSPGHLEAAHPLLRTAGLCAVNDGVFEPKHREAIFRLGLGTKGADPRAIGRFGKGLKSVFAFCEAFFVVAKTGHQNGWSPDERVCEFFNPWNGWRHQDWDDVFDLTAEAILRQVAQEVATFAEECPDWLAFWLPLRHTAHQEDAKGRVAWIHESSAEVLPGQDAQLGDTLVTEFKSLAPSLVTLRNLRRIRLINSLGTDRHITQWTVGSDSRRASEPGKVRKPEVLEGSLVMTNSTAQQTELSYIGLAGTLPESLVASARARHGWPTVVDISEEGSTADQKAKGEPHYGTILTAQPASTGNLEIRWSVFFPVSEQPDGMRSVPLSRLKHSLTLNLHGFFFLDTERRRIDGLQQHFAEVDHACLQWNQIVATAGALAHVPQAFASFAASQTLDFEQAAELAHAFRRTWVWSKFGTAVCNQCSWRPLWRCGTENWELLPGADGVLLIPQTRDSAKVLACIPNLGSLSKLQALAALDADRTLPGLYHGQARVWPEHLVLQVLDGVQLSPTDDTTVADWLNRFLDLLHEMNAVTPDIRDRVSRMPLLPVRIARTGARRRVSVSEWQAAVAAEQLFAPGQQTDNWLRVLHPALPEWSCIVAEWNLPAWFQGQHPSVLDGHIAASAVISQSRLGDFPARTELVRCYLSQTAMPEPVRLAVRYLMHGHAPQSQNDEQFLFVPSTHPGQLIWSRLIGALLLHEGGGNSWRVLHQQWASVLSPQALQALSISTIDAQGAWEELMTAQINFGTLDFPLKDWSIADIATLLHGLFQAGRSDSDGTIALLRKLRLHTLRGQPTERVSIANADGKLGDLFVLNALDFESSIPKELLALWERFLSTTKIVERVQDSLAATVQEKLFLNSTAEGEAFEATLDWNYVVRRCLDSSGPCEWAPLIMEALSHGDQAVRGLGAKLKQTEWLPLSATGNIAPDSVILIDGLEAELHELLDPAEDGLAGIRALPESVVGHDGLATLKKYFPNLEDALGLLGLWLKDKPAWHLGLVESSLPPEIDKFLPSVETLVDLPGAALLGKLWRLPNQATNVEWDALLQETVWKSLFRPFASTSDGAIRLERVLSHLATGPSRIAYDAYLRQAVADAMAVPMLPRLSLVNQRGQWRPASQLIWPSANLDPAAQLCHEQAEILSPTRLDVRQNRTTTGAPVPAQVPLRGNQLNQEPDFEAQADTLAEYIKPFRNGNVGDVLPAALVAVLGSTPKMSALLHELLESGLGQQSDDFVALLLGEDRKRLIEAAASERFLIEIVRGDSTKAQTITGTFVTVSLTNDISSLLVGDPDALWCRYFYHYREETACHLLRLRAIERPDELSDPVVIFASTIETILLKVHCNGVASLCPSNLKEVLAEVADAGQADLRRSQLYLLDMAEARLKELAVRGLPEFDRVLQQFSDARQARVDAELMKTQAPSRAREKNERAESLLAETKRTLVNLLQSPQNEITQRVLVEAVRRKMTDFQYSLDSVALELFQNADDAVAEWDEMKRGLHPQECQFLLHLDAGQRRLELIHWGRPINRHAFAGFQHGLRRGYDQDLQKMLTLNFSDKGVGSGEQAVIVTGRFGLGFKTVFFVADQPEVISGRLAFEIRGGFFPVPLPLDKANALREWAGTLGSPGLVPTAIRLKWAADMKAEDLSKAFDSFTQIAPLLAIFSRRIRSFTIKNGEDSVTVTSHEQKLTSSGRVMQIQAAQKSYLAFRCQLRGDERPASVLLALDAGGVSHLPESLPCLWITTPTTEHSDFLWALNAPFKPDAGRQRLALNNPVNRQIAEDVAHAWLQSLLELFDDIEVSWDAFARKLALHSTTSFAGWWRQVWGEMTRSWPVCKWEHLRDGGQVLGYVAWGQSTGAMLRFVQQRAAVPAGLPGAYDRLLKSGDAHYLVAGLLADQANGCLALLAEWVSVQAAFPPGHTVDSEVARFLKQAIPIHKFQGELNLRTALNAELSEKQEINHSMGERLGQLFLQCKALFETFSPYAPEVQPLLSSLTKARFLASDGHYHPAPLLLCTRSVAELIDKDEPSRAAFAPAFAVLSTGYSDSALHFFVRARGQLSANATTLAAWVAQACTDKLPAIFRYLVEGELGQQLADELKRPWLDAQRSTSAFGDLSDPDRNELERKFSRGVPLIAHQPLLGGIIEIPPAFQVMEAEVAFRCVSEWWAREHATWTSQYESRTYPPGFPGSLPWPGEDDWDAPTTPSSQSRWLLLFVHAALVPLGFNRIGRDQSFTRFLVNNGWVDVFSRVSTEPQALFAALDNYLGAYLQNTEFHFQMRQFIAFYAVSRNLEAFLDSLRAAEQIDEPDAFNHVFSPNANARLSGTGIVAPPLSGMLGMGTCQLLRELYRLGRLRNPHGYRFAFTPIRKVRRLCTQLFGTDEGYAGASTSVSIFSELQNLGTELKLDPTFNFCFDLPLQILAENKGLRTQVLREDFEAEAMDSPELDAAPSTFTT